ncbi:ribonucleases P/MRP protein subunit pop7 [Gaertneriomyces sp. JEL0708]|nr:ribonucleases P/MRP protein subunit pop7 [Gaertneriomyces sp. JEL0708]
MGKKRKAAARVPVDPSDDVLIDEQPQVKRISVKELNAVKAASRKQSQHQQKQLKDEGSLARHKRPPQRAPTLSNDIYVSRKSSFLALAKRAQKLLDGKEFTFLTIHGMGAALNRAIQLALHLREKNNSRISWTITTSSVTLIDDVEPEDVDDETACEVRQNSAIHIRIVKVAESSALIPSQPPL